MIVPDAWIGPVAGLSTSALWVMTSILFTAAGRCIGATLVNVVRLLLAVALLAVTWRLLDGTWFPSLGPTQLRDLALSGVLGLALCDQALFTSFLDLGPRRALVIMTTSPVFATLFGRLFLGEVINPWAAAGMALTMGGVAWVILERPSTGRPARAARRGVILAAIASASQAGGLWLSKAAMRATTDAPEVDALPATYVRMVFGAATMLGVVALLRLRRRPPARIEPSVRRRGLLLASAGAIVGPYLGVWLSLVTVAALPLGIAQTLCSLSPVMILPFAQRIDGERVSLRAAVGALISVVGVAIIVNATGAAPSTS